jgi:hypothetical protein
MCEQEGFQLDDDKGSWVNCPKVVLPDQLRLLMHKLVDIIEDPVRLVQFSGILVGPTLVQNLSNELKNVWGSYVTDCVSAECEIGSKVLNCFYETFLDYNFQAFVHSLISSNFEFNRIEALPFCNSNDNLKTLKVLAHRKINSIAISQLKCIYVKVIEIYSDLLLEFKSEKISYPGKLNSKLWISIFSFVDFEEVFSSLRLISKFHLNIAQSNQYLSQVQDCTISNNAFWTKYMDPMVLLSNINIGENQLRALTLNNISFFDDGSAYILSQYCKNLEILRIHRCDSISDVGFKFLSNSCNNLIEFSIRGSLVSDDSVIAILNAAQLSLNSLAIKFCKVLTNRVLYAAFELCESLKILQLQYCPNFSESTLNELFNRCSLSFESLDFYDIDISDETIKYICTSSSELNTIRILDCAKVSDIGVTEVFSGLPNIEEICLSCSDFQLEKNAISDRTLFALGRAPLTRLKTINLSFCSMTEDGFKYAFERLPNLSSLTLNSCGRLHSSLFLILAQKSLIYLSLTQCSQVSDKSLLDLSVGIIASTLQEVCFDSCDQISEAGIISFTRNCKKLSKMRISNCIMICPDTKQMLISMFQSVKIV